MEGSRGVDAISESFQTSLAIEFQDSRTDLQSWHCDRKRIRQWLLLDNKVTHPVVALTLYIKGRSAKTPTMFEESVSYIWRHEQCQCRWIEGSLLLPWRVLRHLQAGFKLEQQRWNIFITNVAVEYTLREPVKHEWPERTRETKS